MKTTLKALDSYDSLQAGHTYDVRTLGGSRLVALTDVSSSRLISLYKWQLEDGLMRGKLAYVDNVQSSAMSGAVVATLCRSLPSKYIY